MNKYYIRTYFYLYFYNTDKNSLFSQFPYVKIKYYQFLTGLSIYNQQVYIDNIELMTQAQSILKSTSGIAHIHILHYSVTIVALASIIGALYYVSKNRNKRSTYKVKLIEKSYSTHDTALFTFILPRTRKALGLKVGEHVQIEAVIDGKIVNRKYTPISRIDRKSTFQLLIKIYHKCEQFPEGGVLSQYLDSLQINEEIKISLPYGRFNYQKQGQVKISTLDKKTWKRKYKNFYLVAGGTGITPIYQIIQYITQQEKDVSPNITLLFANRTEDDILLLKELRNFEQMNPKLKVHFSVDRKIKDSWNGMTGFVDEDKISKSLGNFTDDINNTIFLSCGPPILSNITQKIWRTKYHVQPQNMYRF